MPQQQSRASRPATVSGRDGETTDFTDETDNRKKAGSDCGRVVRHRHHIERDLFFFHPCHPWFSF
jgi:hypothetical protein